jgi:signal transduction histidine kinase
VSAANNIANLQRACRRCDCAKLRNCHSSQYVVRDIHAPESCRLTAINERGAAVGHDRIGCSRLAKERMGSSDQDVASRLRSQNPTPAADFNALLLAMAAHDLRQPLHVISRSYDWLAERHAGDREAAFLHYGRQAIRQLTDQIDRLVEAMRIQECGPDIGLGPVELEVLFERLRDDNAHAAARAGIDLHVASTSATVMSNPTVLESILRNLVHNALKYSHSAGRVLVGCRRQGAELRIEVHDTGAGIPGHALTQIFEAFRRLDSNTSDGLGLGLLVVRRGADLLGHRIEVQSQIGRGSRFSVMAKTAATTTSISRASDIIPRTQTLEPPVLQPSV